MTFNERLRAIRDRATERRLALLAAVRDGVHSIETPDPVMMVAAKPPTLDHAARAEVPV
jgi:hypothetical protein